MIYHQLVNFSATTLSAFYLDILKDRLYASAAGSLERRSAQTAMYRIVRALTAAEAPILPFTAEEIWSALPGKKEESVHLARFDALDDVATKNPRDRLGTPDETEGRGLRDPRRSSPGEAHRILLGRGDRADGERGPRGRPRGGGCPGTRPGRSLHRFRNAHEGREAPPGLDWRDSQAYPGLRIAFVKARGRRCERCWKVKPEVEESGLCDRCRSVIGGAAA